MTVRAFCFLDCCLVVVGICFLQIIFEGTQRKPAFVTTSSPRKERITIELTEDLGALGMP